MAIIKDFITRSGIILQGTSAVTSSTGQTGALQVNSGAAIAKNLIVGQSAQIYGSVNLYDQLIISGNARVNGIFTASSTANLQGNVTVGGTLDVTGGTTLGLLTVTNTAIFDSTLRVNGATTFNAPVFVTGTNTLVVGTGTASFGGVVSITSNEVATTGGNGALRVTGGAYLGGNLVVNSASANTLTNTDNALYVAGGAWIEKTFVVSGDTTFRGNVTFNGTQTNVYSTNTVYTDNILNLHVPSGSIGGDHIWTVDDGKDIGFMFHYYEGGDKDGFLGLSNSSGYLEWYDNSLENNGVITATNYGIFKTGGIRLVNTETATSSSTGALQVVGGVSAGNVYATNNISGNTLTARGLTQNRIVFVGSGGQLTDSGNLTFDGTTLTTTVTTANNATNLLGGAVGSIPFQTATNQTVFLPIGNSGEILYVSGGKPAWTSASGLSAGNANTSTNLAGGTAGQVPYQTGPGNTSFFGPGNVGQLLQSNGTSGPTYINTGNVFVGFANRSLNIDGGAAGQIPIQSSGNTTRFIPAGADDTYLRHDGTTATFVSTASIFVGNAVTATNIRAGTAGQIVFQSAPNVTSFTGPGNVGEVLVSNGTSGPVFQNTLRLAGTTTSTSTDTGALQVVGGVGIGGNLYVGGSIYGTLIGTASTANTVVVTNDTSTTTTHYLTFVSGTSGSLPITVNGNGLVFVPSTGNLGLGNTTPTTKLDISGGLRVSGISTITNATQSTSISSGALQVSGGTGISGNLWVGGTSNVAGVASFTNTTNASSTNTGALVVSGGAGIGGNLFVGGNINIAGTISGTLSGNASTVSAQFTNTNATHFLAFVDSNNNGPSAESIYTTSSFIINPSNGNVNIVGALTIGSAVSGSTVNALYSNNILLSSYTTPALTSVSTVTLDSLSTSSYRTARYTVQVVRGNDVHVTEAVLFHDGVSAYLNEYGISTTSGGELGIFDATITTGNLLFTFTPASTASTVVKVVRMALTS